MLTLQIWCPGELLLTVDPRRHGTPFAAGIHTLPPGSAVPIHRRQFHDTWWVVLKGQGRLIVEARASTVVPGASAFVPRQTWHGLRNTGTGMLQLAWVSAPGGCEDFFRELSQRGSTADASAIHAMAARHGIEVRPEGEIGGLVAERARPGRRRHRRGRRGRGQTPQAAPQPTPQGAAPTAPVPTTVPPVPIPPSPAPATPQRHGRRHRRRRSRPSPRAQPQAPTLASSATRSARTTGEPRPSGRGGTVVNPERISGGHGREAVARGASTARPARPRGSARRGRFGRVKEVYMGGRWVRVSGEGPVISSEHTQAQEGHES